MCYYQNLKPFAKTVIESLFKMINHENITIDAIEEIDHLKELAYICLKTLSYFADINDFFAIFAESKKPLISNVILPCIILTEKEQGDLSTNPSEFVQYS